MDNTEKKVIDKNTVPVEFTINGKPVKAQAGMTLLEAAKSAGIFIPTLCQLEGLSNYGACRLCMVELVRKGRSSRLVASCLFPVENGLEVLTESERISKHRKVILELVVARWPWVDKELLGRYGVQKNRFEENTNFCILCGLCVRYCSEVKKANVLGFIGRGTERQVVIFPELAEKHCPSCRVEGGYSGCVSVCPTGVIPSEFANTGARLGKNTPMAHPVRLLDDNNLKDVSKTVGDS